MNGLVVVLDADFIMQRAIDRGLKRVDNQGKTVVDWYALAAAAGVTYHQVYWLLMRSDGKSIRKDTTAKVLAALGIEVFPPFKMVQA